MPRSLTEQQPQLGGPQTARNTEVGIDLMASILGVSASPLLHSQ
jgi:hypothetical protein